MVSKVLREPQKPTGSYCSFLINEYHRVNELMKLIAAVTATIAESVVRERERLGLRNVMTVCTEIHCLLLCRLEIVLWKHKPATLWATRTHYCISMNVPLSIICDTCI